MNSTLKQQDERTLEEKGSLTFRHQVNYNEDLVEKKSPLLAMLESNKGSGLYRSTDDIDEYINNRHC